MAPATPLDQRQRSCGPGGAGLAYSSRVAILVRLDDAAPPQQTNKIRPVGQLPGLGLAPDTATAQSISCTANSI
jgi:hypothetical protein